MKKIKMDRKKKIIMITAIIVVVLLASLVFILFMNKKMSIYFQEKLVRCVKGLELI